MRNICSWLVSGIILFAISGVAYAGDYYCAERSPRTARPVFVCKDVKKARKDMRKVVKASHVRAVHERLDDLAEALGLSRGTPLAMCAEGRGFAAAVLPTVAASPVSRWTGSGITPLANGMYEIRGDAAEQMASGCSGNTGGGVGGGVELLRSLPRALHFIDLGGRVDASGPGGGHGAAVALDAVLRVRPRPFLSIDLVPVSLGAEFDATADCTLTGRLGASVLLGPLRVAVDLPRLDYRRLEIDTARGLDLRFSVDLTEVFQWSGTAVSLGAHGGRGVFPAP